MKKLHFLAPILVMFILMSFDAFGKDKDSQPEFSAEVAQEETTYGLGILETASPKRTSSPSSMDKFDINQTIVRTGGKKPHIIAYFHADGTDFSGKIKAGLTEVSRDLGLEMDFRAPRPFNMKKYRELLIAGINETPDGIVVTNPNAEAMNPLINEAVKKGIPVITYNTENPGAKRLAFYGQNLENSGRIMGEKLAELMKGKGKILILSSLSEASWSQAREKGLRLALKQHPDIRQTPSITTGAFMPGLREVLKKQLEMHKDVTAIACLGGNGRHVGNLLREADRKDLIHVMFDVFPDSLLNIRDGYTQFTIDQNAHAQIYLAMKAMYDYLVMGKQPQDTDTGTKLITAENVNDYLSAPADSMGDNTFP